MPLFKQTSPSFYSATEAEKRSTIERLIQRNSFGSGYYILLVLSAFITTCGFLVESSAVVIGGMILAPVMTPLLSLALSLLRTNAHTFILSIRTLLVSIGVVLLLAGGLTYAMDYLTLNTDMWLPLRFYKEVYIMIAVCSGIAGAFGIVKEDISPSVAGVAVAVSLLPPLCLAGVGFSSHNSSVAQRALTLFGANIIGIVIGAFCVFWLLGFLSVQEQVEEKIIEKTNGEKG